MALVPCLFIRWNDPGLAPDRMDDDYDDAEDYYDDVVDDANDGGIFSSLSAALSDAAPGADDDYDEFADEAEELPPVTFANRAEVCTVRACAFVHVWFGVCRVVCVGECRAKGAPAGRHFPPHRASFVLRLFCPIVLGFPKNIRQLLPPPHRC